jgi:hypothetical protein
LDDLEKVRDAEIDSAKDLAVFLLAPLMISCRQRNINE